MRRRKTAARSIVREATQEFVAAAVQVRERRR